MQQENRPQTEKIRQRKKTKRHVIHYLFIYLICLLAAFITWLLVRYSMYNEQKEAEAASLAYAVEENAPLCNEDIFYV